MSVNPEQIIDGKTYVATPAPIAGTCNGCAGQDTENPTAVTKLCRDLGTCDEVIFKQAVKPEPVCAPASAWPFPNPQRAADPSHGDGAARISDPATSQAAAAKVKAGPLRQRIENLLRGNGNFTGTEIARMLDARLNSVTPRFAELAKAGRIKDSGRTRGGEIVWQAV